MGFNAVFNIIPFLSQWPVHISILSLGSLYTHKTNVFGVYWNRPICPSVCRCIHPCVQNNSFYQSAGRDIKLHLVTALLSPVLCRIFFPSHIIETMDSKEIGMNPVAMTIIMPPFEEAGVYCLALVRRSVHRSVGP